jgi:hypothetical protein
MSVSPERTKWRDQALSERHREWGFNCPSVDLDFLMVEYNLGVPVAIVEYKAHGALTPDLRHPTYRALRALADGFSPDPLPFLIAFYWRETWAFRVTPVNDKARTVYRDGTRLSERRFVESLYHLRGLKIESDVLNRLHTEMPPEAQAA